MMKPVANKKTEERKET